MGPICEPCSTAGGTSWETPLLVDGDTDFDPKFDVDADGQWTVLNCTKESKDTLATPTEREDASASSPKEGGSMSSRVSMNEQAERLRILQKGRVGRETRAEGDHHAPLALLHAGVQYLPEHEEHRGGRHVPVLGKHPS